ncbi:MAG: cobyrinate a,c-diamide synthase [Desulfitobacteriaceae bacterium]
MRIPRIVLGGTHSGVGKTTLATGIMAALSQRGHPIQPYKVGPDYIDPSYHTMATGKPSRNLDRWLLGERMKGLFTDSAQEHWAVIEGVMGLFDGMSGTPGFGSTADIAKELRAPVVLIVDATSMARSAAAVVYGFKQFDPELNVVGVIFNRVKSSVQEKMLREAVQELNLPVVGCVPRESNVHLPERHLGLIPVGESGLYREVLEGISKLVEESIDLNLLEKIMLEAPELPDRLENNVRDGTNEANIKRIGIAWDEAFLFYYQDALDLLASRGFSLVPFSPLHDPELPPELDGLILGGGFPELHLPELSGNVSFLESVRLFARSQKPIYAECGGYMYLGQTITDFQGHSYPLTGLIPLRSEMTPRLQGMGYRTGVLEKDSFLGPAGITVHGHEFHYSRAEVDGERHPAFSLFKGGVFARLDGYAKDNIVASYLHLDFAGHPELLDNWTGFYLMGSQR